MARIGKKILSAFVDVEADPKQPPVEAKPAEAAPVPVSPATEQRFAGYFDKLFSDANIPGPDYYEFSRMIGAMQAIADERARYAAAFSARTRKLTSIDNSLFARIAASRHNRA